MLVFGAKQVQTVLHHLENILKLVNHVHLVSTVLWEHKYQRNAQMGLLLENLEQPVKTTVVHALLERFARRMPINQPSVHPVSDDVQLVLFLTVFVI